MLSNVSGVQVGTVQRQDNLQPTQQPTNDRGVSQVPSSGPQVGQSSGVHINPLAVQQPTLQTHYLDSSGQMQPRSIKPLAYDAQALRADAGGATTWGSIKNKIPFLGKTTYGQILKLADNYGAGAAGKTPTEKLKDLGTLKTKLQDWQAKHGDGSSPTASAKQTAIANMLGAVNQAITEARSDALREARDQLLPKLPQGVTIGPDGRIGGSTQVPGIPAGAQGMGEYAGLATKDFIEQLGSKGITPKVGEDGLAKPLPTLAGIPVAGQAPNDFYRLDMSIPTPQGTYVSRQDAEKTSDTRNGTMAQQLRAYSGSDKATTVLSGVLNQQLLRILSDAMVGSDGAQKLLALGAHGTQGQVMQPDGSFEDVRMFNMGGAKFELSKTQGGDFQVKVDWPMYVTDTGRGSSKESLPGMKEGQVIEARGTLTFVIDKAEADQGRLSVTLPTPAQVQFKGGLDI
jgi:hypothetical protein